MNRRLLIGLAAAFCVSGPRVHAQFHGLAKGDVLRGQFTRERAVKGLERPLLSRGEFVLAPGQGLIWRTEKPFLIVTTITRSGLTQEVGGSETTHLDSARLPFLARLYDLLGGALAGDWRALETEFQVTRGGDAQSWEMVLVPHPGADPNIMPFESVTLRGARFLNEARFIRPGGDTEKLMFTDQALGAGGLSPVEAAQFARGRD